MSKALKIGRFSDPVFTTRAAVSSLKKAKKERERAKADVRRGEEREDLVNRLQRQAIERRRTLLGGGGGRATQTGIGGSGGSILGG